MIILAGPMSETGRVTMAISGLDVMVDSWTMLKLVQEICHKMIKKSL